MGATHPTKSIRLEPDERKVLGAWLKLTSQALGIRQREFEARCGLDRMTVSQVYTGRVVKRTNYELLCKEFGYTFDEALALALQTLDHVIDPLTRGPADQEPRTQETGMYDQATVITVCAEKGGVGKTTTAVTLATMFAERGHRVLVVDLDPQANATAWLLGEYPEDAGKSQILAFEESSDLPVTATTHGVDLVASGRIMARLPGILNGMTAGYLQLKKRLKSMRQDYDYVLVDTPPSLGVVTIGALSASHHALLPARTEGFSLDALECTMDTCMEVQEDLNEGLDVLGCVILDHDKRTVISREVLRAIGDVDGLSVLEPCIASCVYFKEASTVREPIYSYRPKHRATLQFRTLAARIDGFCRPVKQVVG